MPFDLGHVFDQPVDGVVGVSRLIDWGGVEGAVEGPVHHVVALAAVFAANVLHDSNVAAFEDGLGGVVVAQEAGAEMGAVALVVSVIALYGVRVSRMPARFAPLGTRMTVCSLTLVAHGDHDFAASVVHAVGGLMEGGGSLAGVAWIFGGVLRLQ